MFKFYVMIFTISFTINIASFIVVFEFKNIVQFFNKTIGERKRQFSGTSGKFFIHSEF